MVAQPANIYVCVAYVRGMANRTHAIVRSFWHRTSHFQCFLSIETAQELAQELEEASLARHFLAILPVSMDRCF